MTQKHEFEQLLLKGPEVATVLGCSRAQAYKLMGAGVLPTVRFGGKSLRVPRGALLAWIERNTRMAEAN